jgi:multidrug resistance efflux pump
VVAVPAVEGKLVEEGTVLVQMDDTLEKRVLAEAEQDLSASREKLVQANNLVVQHQKKVAVAKAGLEVARRDIDLARDLQEKAKRLYNNDVGGSKEDVAMAGHAVQKAEAALKVREEEVAALEAIDSQGAVRLAGIDVKAKEAQVDKACYNLGLCQLKAKTRGRVLRSQVTVGETLGPNPQRPAILFCPDKPLIVRAEVEQEFARFVQVNQKATIQDDATGGGSWTGKVRSLSQWYTHRRSILLEPLQFNDVRTLECILDLDPATANTLRIGQRVRVTLEVGS